jgi:predicted metal-dependent peptidase
MAGEHSARATRALRKLGELDPAFAALALWCAHRDGETGGPAARTDGATIWYGPAFAALPLHEQVGLAAHHVLHVAFRHAPRAAAMWERFGDGFDAELYNLATDAIVNETLGLAGYALPRPCATLTGLVEAALGERTTPEAAVGRWDAEALYLRLAARPAGGR